MVASTTGPVSAAWDPREDRRIYVLWIAIIWLGMVLGFGVHIPNFLKQQPPPPTIVYVHAVVFTGWLVLVTTQIALIRRSAFALHRRLGIAALFVAAVMLYLGPATALALEAQHPHDDHGGLSLNFIDIAGFGILTAAGFAYRANAAAHKRLMMLATVALSDPGFARFSDFAVPSPPNASMAYVLTHLFYGNFLLIAAMAIWDLWRRGRLHPVFVVGATFLVLSEVAIVWLMYNAAWSGITARIVQAWG